MFVVTEIEKHKFHQDKIPVWIYDVNINEILVSRKVSFGEMGIKYFIGSNDVENVKSLGATLPKMSAYLRDLDGLKSGKK